MIYPWNKKKEMKLADIKDIKNVEKVEEPNFIDNDFNPKFSKVTSIAECADLINRPHEDYPKRVQRTQELIEYYTNGGGHQIMEFDAMQMHSFVMWDLPSRGKYRSSDVTVGKWSPPSPMKLKELILKHHIFPISSASDGYLVEWYKRFQSLHPFEDGNGRVGGIIVAILSWNGKTLLAPHQ